MDCNEIESLLTDAVDESPIGVGKVSFGEDCVGYYSEDDWYADLLEDIDNDFVVYNGIDELQDLIDEDYDNSSVQIEPFNPNVIADVNYKILQLSYGILIVRDDFKRLIIRTDKQKTEFSTDDLLEIANNNDDAFAYPNDEGLGEITLN